MLIFLVIDHETMHHDYFVNERNANLWANKNQNRTVQTLVTIDDYEE